MESDDELFLKWVQKKIGIYLTDKDEDRLFALARKGAEGWRPIDENTPEFSNILLCAGKRVVEGWRSEDRWYCAGDERIYGVSHWMPLPAPPEKENADGE